MTSVEDRIAALLRDRVHVVAPAADADLIELGLLDSLALVSLIAAIEEDFGRELPLDGFDVEHFRSVERIAAFVTATLPAAAPEGRP
jgi:acyl carrier protein